MQYKMDILFLKESREQLMRKLFSFFSTGFRKTVFNMRRRTLLVPTLISFLSFTFAVLLIISVWFTRSVMVTMEEMLEENATFSSVKAAGLLKSSFEDIVDTAAHLKEINALSPRSYRDDPYAAYRTLRLFKSSKYSDLVFCYDDSPCLLTIYGTCYPAVCFSEIEQPQELLDALHDVTSVGLISTASFGAAWDESRLLLHYPLSSQHTAVFVLTSSRMSGIIANAIGPADGVQVLYASDGTVLWSSRALDDQVHAQLFGNMNKLASGDTITLNQTDYIFSFNNVDYGARLVVLEKITTQFDKLNMIITMLVVICVAIILLSVLFLIYNVSRSYVPIANLVRELRTVLPDQQETADSDISTLRHACSQYSVLLQESRKTAALFSEEQLRSLFVLRTISGQYTDAEQLYHLCHSLEIDFPYSCFFACLLLFDGIHSEQEKRALEKYLYHTAHEAFHAYFYLLPDGLSAVGIINVPTDDPDQLCVFGEQMLAHLPDSLRATLGIGQIRRDIASLGKSYLEAHAALDYRLIKGKNTWITYREINFSDPVSAYPHQLIDSYVNTLRTWDVQDIREKLQQITDYIYTNNLPLQQVKCICFDLTSAFLREIASLDRHVTYKPNTAYDVFNIAEYESVSELAQKIASFSENIQQYIVKHNAHQSHDLICQCEEYMRENISNVQFSLSSCAERFNISQQTMRRKFKEATGQTLSNYMTVLRIEHAKNLLVSSSLDINAICEQCGYLDLSSFIRLFKAETGVSPGKYREIHQGKT